MKENERERERNGERERERGMGNCEIKFFCGSSRQNGPFQLVAVFHPPHAAFYINDCYIINSSCPFRSIPLCCDFISSFFFFFLFFSVETGRKCWRSKLNWPPSWKCRIISFA